MIAKRNEAGSGDKSVTIARCFLASLSTMFGFQIRHDVKGQTGAAELLVSEGFLFETCLRKIWIEPETENIDQDPCVLRGPEAYRFLLETICGLKSPLFGETEILGQFKQFLATMSLNPQFSFFKPWGQGLLEDTKKIRTDYLRGHTSQSYGSLLRKKIPQGQSVTILGAGLLAESLLPWLATNPTDLWVRNPQKSKSKFPGLPVKALSEKPEADSWVLVAAPLEETELSNLLENCENSWIDLRDKGSQEDRARLVSPGSMETALSSTLRPALFDLKDLFSEIQQNQERINALKHDIHRVVVQLSALRYEKAWFRPLGWEDLCVS